MLVIEGFWSVVWVLRGFVLGCGGEFGRYEGGVIEGVVGSGSGFRFVELVVVFLFWLVV